MQPAAELGLDLFLELAGPVADVLGGLVRVLRDASETRFGRGWSGATAQTLPSDPIAAGAEEFGITDRTARRYSHGRGGLEARTAPGALSGLRGQTRPPPPERTDPQARRRDARRQPAVGQGRRDRHRAGPSGRCRQHRAAARLVRGDRRRGGHAVAALHRQPEPPGQGARAAARHHRRRRRDPRRAAALAAAPGGRARPAAGRRWPSGSRPPPSPPATSTGCWSTSPSGTAAAARSRTPYVPCCTSTPARAPPSRSWPGSSTSTTSPSTSTPRASPTPTS